MESSEIIQVEDNFQDSSLKSESISRLSNSVNDSELNCERPETIDETSVDHVKTLVENLLQQVMVINSNTGTKLSLQKFGEAEIPEADSKIDYSKYLNAKDGVIKNLFMLLDHQTPDADVDRDKNLEFLEAQMDGKVLEKGLIKLEGVGMMFMVLSVSTDFENILKEYEDIGFTDYNSFLIIRLQSINSN